MKNLNPLGHLIIEATGAAVDDVACIENIMREEIFHSTLDWQTREQLVNGARQAQQRLKADRESYDRNQQIRVALFQEMSAAATADSSNSDPTTHH